MKLPFLGQAYKSRSPILASQSCINLYAESTEGNSDSVASFYGAAGLISIFSGSGEVRGAHKASDGNLYVVVGKTCYRVDKTFVATALGDLPSLQGIVSIGSNASQVAFAHADGWHWVSFTGSTIAPVANSPKGSVLAVQDNYVIFTENVDQQFGITALADLSSIDPLDVASAEGAPDDLVSCLSDHREVWLFCEETTEIWADTGASFFPFERQPGGFLETGCAAKWSPAKGDNSVFWVSRDTNGRGIVVRANAYIPTRISTHALEAAINSYGDISDAIGWTYQEEGHTFYWLTFPSADASWVFDVATGMWSQRAWRDPMTGELHRHRANCHTFFNNWNIVGDWQNGQVYRLDIDAYTDNGDPIYRERAFDVPDSEDKKIRLDFIELQALTGDGSEETFEIRKSVLTADTVLFSADSFSATADGFAGSTTIAHAPDESVVWLQISRDSGRRFGAERYQSLGKIGQRKARARWRHGGMGRNVVLKFATTMSNRVYWQAVYGRGEALDQ